MHRKLSLVAGTLSIIFTCSSAHAQSWGQLKSAACEAEAANKLDDAVSYWNKALEACSPDIPARYVQSLAGLAQCYVRQNKNAEAEELYKKILSMSKEGALTDEHKAALTQYTDFLKKQNKESEAASLEKKFALTQDSANKENTKASIPAASANTNDDLKQWQSLVNSASKEASLKHYVQAEKLYQDALALSEKMPGAVKQHSETLSRLISLYYAQEKFAEAEPHYIKSMGLTKRSSGAESAEYANALRNHGALLRRLNRKNEAMAEEAKADAIMYKQRAGSSSSGNSAGLSSGAVDSSGTRGGSIYSRAGAASGAPGE
jgi:tetratricopeptide (TPR) repeat protein